MFASLRDVDGVLWKGGLPWADMEVGELERRFGLRGIVRHLYYSSHSLLLTSTNAAAVTVP
jgi:hypothetical protein